MLYSNRDEGMAVYLLVVRMVIYLEVLTLKECSEGQNGWVLH